LAQRRVPATFFMLGVQIERAPGLAQAVSQAGHMVGNHSYSHRRLDVTSPEMVDWEILHTTQRIHEVCGVHPSWFRPPGGNVDAAVYTSAANATTRVALWTIDPQDWRTGPTPEEIAWSVISTAHPNGIIVLHDGGGDRWRTIAALPIIIDALRGAGYQFVTLDQLPEVKSGW
ncbi:polysaccharide deacetylase family protein, partial [bacterium]|nr:polysaccharide deacetylase family protein [bacterium]